MLTAAQCLVVAFGLWLIVVSGLMLTKPKTALRLLSKAASTNLINYGEITLRLIAGVALIISAASSKAPGILHVAGIFIAGSSLVLYFVPRTWHAKYALWWSERLEPQVVRLLTPFSLAVGLWLIYAVVS